MLRASVRGRVDRALALALASAGAGLLSWSTFPLRDSTSPVSHLAQNATWGLVVAAVVGALLASDGIKRGKPGVLQASLGIALVAAGLRAASLFAW